MDFLMRREALRARAATSGIGFVAVAPGPNMDYLLGYHPHVDERPCFLIIAERGDMLIVPELNAGEVGSKVDVPMQTYADAEGPQAAVAYVARQLHLWTAQRAMVEEAMRYDFVIEIARVAPDLHLETSVPLLAAMRMHKDADEIAAIYANAEMADRVVEKVFDQLKLGRTEADVADDVRQAFAGQGADQTNFAIVASGPNGAFPHHASSARRLGIGDAIVLDIGAHHHDYNSDITRMAFIGQPTEEYWAVHAVVEAAVQAALTVIRPGIAASEIDRVARRTIEDAGYGPYFTHRLGHGLGVTGHEPPYITGTNTMPLERGMTFSVEPGIYLPGRFGVRLEEIVLVTDGGVEIMSRLPRDVRPIPA